MILTALSDVGGPKYFAEQARANPTAFLALVGRILPLQVQGDRNNPLTVKISVEEHRRRALIEIERAFPEPPAKQVTVIEHEPARVTTEAERVTDAIVDEPELDDEPDNVIPLSPKPGV